MTDVDAVTAFIRARIADEERDAQAATPGPWTAGDHPANECRIEGPGDFTIYDEGGHTAADARHIARQDPAATLARIAALRALVEHLARTEAAWNRRGIQIYDVAETAEAALRHVAAIWRDHPDYQPEWVTSG